jgi:hypothetical protein
MTPNEILSTRTFTAYAEFCVEKGIDATETRMMLTVRRLLERFDDDTVARAVREISYTSRFYPDASAVIEHMSLDKDHIKDEGMLLAADIIECAGSVGQSDIETAKRRIGPKGWDAVLSFGGWHLICTTQTSDLPSVRAQLRDLCRAQLGRSAKLNGVIKDAFLPDGGASKRVKVEFKPQKKLLAPSIENQCSSQSISDLIEGLDLPEDEPDESEMNLEDIEEMHK